MVVWGEGCGGGRGPGIVAATLTVPGLCHKIKGKQREGRGAKGGRREGEEESGTRAR